MQSQARHIREADGDLAAGASGLIGTGLIAALRSLRTRGVKVEMSAHGFSPPSEVFTQWHEQGHLHLLRSNLAEPESWAQLPQADLIIHAAGCGQPGKFMEAPLHALMLNTGATGVLPKSIRQVYPRVVVVAEQSRSHSLRLLWMESQEIRSSSVTPLAG